MSLGVSAKLVCFMAGVIGVLAALTDSPFIPPPPIEASSNSVRGTEASVSVDTDEGLPLPLPRCNVLTEAAAAGGAVIVTIVLAALFTADVEL